MAGKKKKKGSNTTLYLILGTIGLVFVYLWFGAFKAHEVNRAYGWLSADTIKYCLQYPLEPIVHPVKEAGMYLLLIIVFGGFAIFFTINNQRPKDDGPNVKGDAHFMTPEEIHTYDRKYVLNPYYGPDEKTVDDVKGDGSSNGKQLFEKDPPKQIEAECRRQTCIVSSSIFLSFDNIWSRKNTNALIVGTAGSGKSRYYVGPNILQCNTNYIITDPSGDLFSQYAKYLENNGYDVKKLDLEDMYNSERYNPLKYLEDEKDVFTLVNMLIENLTAASGGSGKEEPIWKDSKSALLRAVIFFLWEYESDPKKKNFTNVLRLINSAKFDENAADSDDNYINPFDEIFEKIRSFDPNSQAVTQYDIFQSAGTGKTRDSILITTTSQLSLFGSSNIAHLTATDEMDLDSFADKKSALFICIPTVDNTFNFLASMLYSQLFLKLYNYAEKRTKYSWHVYMDYTEDGIRHNENIRVFQAKDEEDSKNAKEKAEELLKKIKDKKIKIEYDDFKDLYYIVTDDEAKEKIAWRGGSDGENRIHKLLKDMEKHAKVRPGDNMRLPEHCHFILDEFANTGKIPTFCEKLSTIRKYRINCSIIVQSPDQLKNMYEKEYNVIIDNCNIKLFLGTNSPETAKWVSETLGNKTVVARSESWNSGNNGGSESFQKDKQELMPADKVLGMENYECIAMVYGGNNVYEQKYEISNHPCYKEAMKYKDKFKSRRVKKKIDDRDKAAMFAASSIPDKTSSSESQDNGQERKSAKGRSTFSSSSASSSSSCYESSGMSNFVDEAMNDIPASSMNSSGSSERPNLSDSDLNPGYDAEYAAYEAQQKAEAEAMASVNETNKNLAKRDLDDVDGVDMSDADNPKTQEAFEELAKSLGVTSDSTAEEIAEKFAATTGIVDSDEDDAEFAFGMSSGF